VKEDCFLKPWEWRQIHGFCEGETLLW
jgi:hypothetical protein